MVSIGIGEGVGIAVRADVCGRIGEVGGWVALPQVGGSDEGIGQAIGVSQRAWACCQLLQGDEATADGRCALGIAIGQSGDLLGDGGCAGFFVATSIGKGDGDADVLVSIGIGEGVGIAVRADVCRRIAEVGGWVAFPQVSSDEGIRQAIGVS